MKANEEWAIQDEATGEWWNDNYFGKYAPKDKEPTRFQTYQRAAAALVRSEEANLGHAHARIVPAPPREMTDAECWTWFEARSPSACVLAFDAGENGGYIISMRGVLDIPHAETPCDAIRAARRKLES